MSIEHEHQMWKHSNQYKVNIFIVLSYAVNENYIFELRVLSFFQKMGLLRKMVAILCGKTVPGPCDLMRLGKGNIGQCFKL